VFPNISIGHINEDTSMTIKFDPGLADKHAVDPRKTLKGENKHTGLGQELEETIRAPASASEGMPTP
jgi:hypothetical protein